MNSEHVEVLRDLRDLARAAIDAGDWVVDGACDPDAVLRRADAAIASLSAPQPQPVNDNAVADNESAPVNDKCPKCDDPLDYDKFSDAVCIGTFYFNVHITACPGCGYVHDDQTWVE